MFIFYFLPKTNSKRTVLPLPPRCWEPWNPWRQPVVLARHARPLACSSAAPRRATPRALPAAPAHPWRAPLIATVRNPSTFGAITPPNWLRNKNTSRSISVEAGAKLSFSNWFWEENKKEMGNARCVVKTVVNGAILESHFFRVLFWSSRCLGVLF